MLTLVPPLDRADRERSPRAFGTFTCATFAPARHMAWTALGHSGEVRPGVAARTRDREAVAMAADGGVKQTTHVGVVHGEEAVDVVRAVEKVLEPRMSPLPSSPTVPTNQMSFSVSTPVSSKARIVSRRQRRPQQLSAMPAPISGRLRGGP